MQVTCSLVRWVEGGKEVGATNHRMPADWNIYTVTCAEKNKDGYSNTLVKANLYFFKQQWYYS
jgi:hypothetical protein